MAATIKEEEETLESNTLVALGKSLRAGEGAQRV